MKSDAPEESHESHAFRNFLAKLQREGFQTDNLDETNREALRAFAEKEADEYAQWRIHGGQPTESEHHDDHCDSNDHDDIGKTTICGSLDESLSAVGLICLKPRPRQVQINIHLSLALTRTRITHTHTHPGEESRESAEQCREQSRAEQRERGSERPG